jgi:Ni/Fe-hydrogenase subunit HybB-like protein
VYLDDFSYESNMFLIEMILGVIIPFGMVLSVKVRRSPSLLFTAAAFFVCFGVLLNRVNVFLTAFHPPYADHRYVPHILEFMVTVGYLSALMLLYRIFVTLFPVITHHPESGSLESQ